MSTARQTAEWIPLAECKKGHLYGIRSRNLVAGVFNGKDGFIGIRIKFGQRSLETEHHWDTGPPHGTAKPLEDLGEVVPEDIPLETYLGSRDRITGRPVDFNNTKATPEEGGNSAGYMGWFFTDTGEHSHEIAAYSVSNVRLYEWIQEREDAPETRET